MVKPRLSFWQIWNMSFGFLGIQFGWTLQMNNIGAIYEFLGAKADQLPILFLAAPVTGLLVQPLIGHWSDNTWNWLGRRRPFFLVGALLSSSMLVLMPSALAVSVRLKSCLRSAWTIACRSISPSRSASAASTPAPAPGTAGARTRVGP